MELVLYYRLENMAPRGSLRPCACRNALGRTAPERSAVCQVPLQPSFAARWMVVVAGRDIGVPAAGMWNSGTVVVDPRRTNQGRPGRGPGGDSASGRGRGAMGTISLPTRAVR